MRAIELLHQAAHRPLPLPQRPYWGHQRWRHLLFAHWPLPAASVAALLPPGLELDTWPAEPESAWLGVVPFAMSGVRPRGLPPLPGVSRFLELNVRTYARYRGQPGVYFFSLDASSWLGVGVARGVYRLPYFRARMRLRRQTWDDHAWQFTSRRRGASSAASFAASYGPVAPPSAALPGSLDHWLTDRYRVFSAAAAGALWASDVHHLPWPLQPARADFHDLEVGAACGLPLAGPPRVLHYVRDLAVLVWGPQRLR